MKNNEDYLSPGEINKFVYCPYQWYYEKTYGTKHIRELYNERNKELGLTDSAKSNFNKGRKFHRDYYVKDKLIKTLKAVVAAALIAGAIWIIIFMRGL